MFEKANAKINLFLNVVGKREDGYHDLKMVTHPIALHDGLEFEISDHDELIGSEYEDDLILKTLKLFKKEYGIDEGVKITLYKRIPAGTGLGGASADAAATLRGLNKMFGTGATLKELAKLGLQLGADVPICIYNKPCVTKGIGEVEYTLEEMQGDVLLVLPNISTSTKEVFSRTEILNMVEKNNEDLINEIKELNIENIMDFTVNDLQEVTTLISREVLETYNKIQKINSKYIMTGSGSAFYNIYNDRATMMCDIKELDNSGIKWLHTKLGV